jgi:hypothetical protein
MRSPHVLGVALVALSAACVVQPLPGYVSSASAALEVNIDRPGGDYRSFELASGRPEECRDTCMTEPQCAAFTFMNPGVQGPGARCWLKSTVRNPAPNACCISGVKSAAPPVADEVPPPAVPPVVPDNCCISGVK